MNLKKYVLGSGLAALLIAGAPLAAFAHDNAQANVSGGFNLGAAFSSVIHSDSRANVNINDNNSGKDNDNDGDKDNDGHKVATSTPRANIEVGTVTAVNGSTFTIAGLFGENGTTTITTNGSTVFKAKGGATTSTAINVGSRVFVVGTTTATSTAGNTFAASLVAILGKCFGGVHAWFSVHGWAK